MKLASAWILLNAVLAQGRPRSLREVDLAMNAAESEVAVHIDAVIKRAKAVDGWDIRDVVSKVDVGVSEILDEHGIGGAMKEQAMDHLDNKLSKMLEEISEEKELNVIKNEELPEEEEESEIAAEIDAVLEAEIVPKWWGSTFEVSKVVEAVNGILAAHHIEGGIKKHVMDHLDNIISRMAEESADPEEEEPEEVMYAEAMNAAESEVAAHMDAVIERAKTTEGWDIRDVVSKVGAGVNEILDEHGIEGAKKEQAMDHLDNKLSKMLEEISEEKELNVIKNEELPEEEESEIAAEIDAVLEAEIVPKWWGSTFEVSKVVEAVNGILAAHHIEGGIKKHVMDHLDNIISRMAEESADPEEEEPEEVMYAEAMNAAESEVAAHMDAVIERAKTTEGWDIRDVVSKVGAGVNEILDEHGIEGAKKEQAMDHLDNKLSKMLEEISEEKELNVIKNEELIEEKEEELFAVEHQVAAEIDAVMERVKATEGWNVVDEVSKVDVVVNGILDAHGIEGREKEHAMDHLNNKLSKELEEILAGKKFEINF